MLVSAAESANGAPGPINADDPEQRFARLAFLFNVKLAESIDIAYVTGVAIDTGEPANLVNNWGVSLS